jgi:hypothetical protein
MSEYSKAYYQANKHKWPGYTGTGSGGKEGIENQNYRHGRTTFRSWARKQLQQQPSCERCNKSIDYLEPKSWAGHHKDHNPTNNVITNLEVLCKQCHQIEHECWKAFFVSKL